MLAFLEKLQKHNAKDWFDEHREEYEAAHSDFENLAESIIAETAKFDPLVERIEPKKAIARMHRDMRFAKNKPPYHTAFRLNLLPEREQTRTASYYLHYEPGNIFMGGGLMGAPAEAVKKVRQEIDHNWKEFQKLLSQKAFSDCFDDLQKGEEHSLKRPPRGYQADNPAIEYLKLKDFVARRRVRNDQITPTELVKEAVQSFKAVKPLLEFINRSL